MKKRIVYPVIATLRTILLILSMLLFISVYLLSLPFSKHSKERAFNLRRNYVRLAIWILGIRLDVQGSGYDKPCLYTSNHRSFSDPLITSIFINAFVIAKAEVSSFPLINKGAELTGIIYVERDNKDSRTATRDALISTIKSGYNVLVYPEGTVNYGPQTLPFRKGSFIEAAKHNIPVVPIALEYRDESDLWYKSNFVRHMFKQFGKWKTETKMVIGNPITDTDGIRLSERVEEWTNLTIQELNTNWSYMFEYTVSEAEAKQV